MVLVKDNVYHVYHSWCVKANDDGDHPIAVDLDGDGRPEILTIIQYEPFKFKLAGFKLFPNQIKEIFSAYLPNLQTGNSESSITAGDIDQDGQTEILLNTLDGRLNVYKFPSPRQTKENRLLWPMFNHDPQNTRNYNFSF